jgi:hypothetical protein
MNSVFTEFTENFIILNKVKVNRRATFLDVTSNLIQKTRELNLRRNIGLRWSMSCFKFRRAVIGFPGFTTASFGLLKVRGCEIFCGFLKMKIRSFVTYWQKAKKLALSLKNKVSTDEEILTSLCMF